MTPEVRELIARWGQFEDITRTSSLLEWDQETYLPPGGARARGIHLATLAGLAHEKIISRHFRRALRAAERARNLSAREEAMIREARREHDRASRIPPRLVREVARAESLGLEAWRRAYRTNRWHAFVRQLTNLVRLKRRVAEAVGYRAIPYDALLDVYEPGATAAQLDPLLAEVKEATVVLVRKIAASRRRPDRRIVTRRFPRDGQLAFAREVAEAMGFDFERGRVDLSTHPFCTGFDPGDVRLTTRLDERDLRVCLFGLIHEAGHGLYEQGIDARIIRTPIGHPISLGIHESQSRLWENVVGRGKAFWKHFLPRLKRVFPRQMKGVRLREFHFAINEVAPSFIRVEADEVTYNLHIILRYEIEKGLLDGTLRPSQLPQVWNRKMKEFLGITPRRDSEGVLQDIHWAMGLFGYFPTYLVGNLYSAQLYARAQREIPDLEERIASGELLCLRDWLRRKVHRPGRMYPAAELLQRATGKKPSTRPFVDYLWRKYGDLYGL